MVIEVDDERSGAYNRDRDPSRIASTSVPCRARPRSPAPLSWDSVNSGAPAVFGPLLIAPLLIATGPTASPLADIGRAPRTVLVDSAGKPFELSSLRGKVVVVSFVYTTCTGVCPGTTQAMVRVKQALEEARLWGDSVAFVSITLDPGRDTPDALRRYARLFRADDAAWHFLSGPPERVRSVIADWGMWVKAGPTGVLDHPSRVFLLDARGHQREIYNLEFLTPSAVLQDVRGLLGEPR
jgi:protein SCO1